MFSKSTMRDNFDLDKALVEEEQAVFESLRTEIQQIAPRAEFAQQLEARLREAAEPLVEPTVAPVEQGSASVLTRPRPRPLSHVIRSGLRLLRLPRARFASVGLVIGMLIVGVLVLSFFLNGSGLDSGVSTVATSKATTPTATTSIEGVAGPFVPPGKVRHLVINLTSIREGTPQPLVTENIWYTNGQNHLLMRGNSSGEGVSPSDIWVEEQAIYHYSPNPDNLASKQPYYPQYVSFYFGPDPELLTRSLNMMDARIVGTDSLNGQPVTIVEGYFEKTAPATPTDGKDSWRPTVKKVVWLDTQEDRLLKTEYTSTYSNGRVDVSTEVVMEDELSDISEIPVDFFKFKLPEGATLVEESNGLFASPPLPISTYSVALATEIAQTPRSEPTPVQGLDIATPQPISDFVPSGKVRHLIITHENSAPGQNPNTWTEDVWLSNGQKHPIMKKTDILPGLTTLVDDNAAWTYGPQFGNNVYKTDYDKKHFAEFIPDKQIIDEMLKQPNTRIVGNETLNNRPVMVLESLDNIPANVQITNAGNKPVVEFASFSDGQPVVVHSDRSTTSPDVTPTITLSGSPTADLTEVIDYRLWIDSQTYQVIQQSYNNRFLKPKAGDKIIVYTRKITLDEVKEASDFPSDLFKFNAPAGASVVEAYHVFTPRLPVPATSLPLPTSTIVTTTSNPAQEYTEDTDKPGSKRFVSNKLGISFNYAKDQVVVEGLGNKVYVGGEPEDGQRVEVFQKDPSDSLKDAIKKQFHPSEGECLINDLGTSGYPSNFQVAEIAPPIGPDESLETILPKAEKCPARYTRTNFIAYFLEDKNHPDRFLFFYIGQQPMMADSAPDSHLMWQETIQVHDKGTPIAPTSPGFSMPTPAYHIEDTQSPGIKRFVSDKLGIRFKYAEKVCQDCQWKMLAEPIANRVYLYRSNGEPEEGQWLEVFTKNKADSLKRAIEKKYENLFGDSGKGNCKIEDVASEVHPGNYTLAAIAVNYGPGDNDEIRQIKEAICPALYTRGKNLAYFLEDKSHLDKFLFFHIGQNPLPADNNRSWQQTIEIFK